MSEISMNAIVSVTDGKISSSVADDVVILDLEKSEYFGFNPVGATIWGLLQKPKTVQSIHQALLSEYDVDSEQCKQDLLHLLLEMKQKGLIDIQE